METKHDDLGFEYYESIPKGYVLVTSPSEFLCLKQGKRKFTEENTEVVSESTMVVYSPHSGRYYIRKVHPWSDPFKQSALMDIINKRRVHILYGDEARKRIAAQYKREGIHYASLVLINEWVYELDYHERWGKFRADKFSNKERILKDIERLSKNKIKRQ